MATRALIGMITESGEIDFIYTHHDGYITNNGLILTSAYDTLDKVRELIDAGSASYLAGSVEKMPHYKNADGETSRTTIAIEDMGKYFTMNDSDIEFSYLFVNDTWLCYYRNWDSNEATMPRIKKLKSKIFKNCFERKFFTIPITSFVDEDDKKTQNLIKENLKNTITRDIDFSYHFDTVFIDAEDVESVEEYTKLFNKYFREINDLIEKLI